MQTAFTSISQPILRRRITQFLLFLGIFLFAVQLSAQTVYITRTGAKYHKESCRYSKTAWASDLAEAKKRGLTACLVCKPSSTMSQSSTITPLVKSQNKPTATAAKSPASTSKPSINGINKPVVPQTNNGQCRAFTQKGTRCSRKSDSTSNYCWQHKK